MSPLPGDRPGRLARLPALLETHHPEAQVHSAPQPPLILEERPDDPAARPVRLDHDHPYRRSNGANSRSLPRHRSNRPAASASNQAVIGLLAFFAFLVDWWPLLAILAAQLAAGLLLGRRYCLPCVAYFELVQPRFGEGGIEDSRPPRFANTVVPWYSPPPASSIWPVSPLPGGCLGSRCRSGAACRHYRALRGLRALRGGTAAPGADRSVATSGSGRPGWTAPDEDIVVQFTHPWCTDCQTLAEQLQLEPPSGGGGCLPETRPGPEVRHRRRARGRRRCPVGGGHRPSLRLEPRSTSSRHDVRRRLRLGTGCAGTPSHSPGPGTTPGRRWW